MRKPRLNLSARQTIALSVFGALVAATGFILPIQHRNAHNIRGWLIVTTFALIAAGFAISFYASTDLESGLLNERWPEDETVATRAFLTSSFFTVTTILCLLSSIGMYLAPRALRPIGWSLLIFGQSLQRLAAAAKPPHPNRKSSPFTPDWNNFSPLRSEHWGERRDY